MVQISVTATAVSGSPIPKSRRTARARSTNSVDGVGFGAVGYPQRGNAEHRLGAHAERLA